MARTAVTFDGMSLQTANIIASQIAHESYDNRNLSIQELANTDGGKLVYERRTPKTIRIQGHLRYDTKAELEAAIDTLKQNLNVQEADLDIAFGGDTRRYTATVKGINIPREHYNINFVPFTIEFEATAGFGEGDSSLLDSTTSAVTEVDRTIITTGTLAPKPQITISIKSETNLNRFIVKNVTTDRTMTIEQDYSTDTLIIDLDTNEVTLNSVNVAYTGTFPEFTRGENNYTITPNATAVLFDSVVSYTARYL